MYEFIGAYSTFVENNTTQNIFMLVRKITIMLPKENKTIISEKQTFRVNTI